MPHSEILNLQELEARAIDRALEVSGGKYRLAAKLLGISHQTLYRKKPWPERAFQARRVPPEVHK